MLQLVWLSPLSVVDNGGHGDQLEGVEFTMESVKVLLETNGSVPCPWRALWRHFYVKMGPNGIHNAFCSIDQPPLSHPAIGQTNHPGF